MWGHPSSQQLEVGSYARNNLVIQSRLDWLLNSSYRGEGFMGCMGSEEMTRLLGIKIHTCKDHILLILLHLFWYKRTIENAYMPEILQFNQTRYTVTQTNPHDDPPHLTLTLLYVHDLKSGSLLTFHYELWLRAGQVVLNDTPWQLCVSKHTLLIAACGAYSECMQVNMVVHHWHINLWWK